MKIVVKLVRGILITSEMESYCSQRAAEASLQLASGIASFSRTSTLALWWESPITTT